jgi:hypothetical protein
MLANKGLASLACARLRRFKCSLNIDLNEPPLSAVILWGLASGSCTGVGYKDQAMEIKSTTFGAITIDGKTYERDVIIRLSGEVVKRKKKLSKKYYGTSHVLSKDEAIVCLREGVQPAYCWLGPNGQCAPIAGSRSLFRKKRLQSSVAADPRCDPGIQQVTCQEDRAFPRDLLKQNGASRDRAGPSPVDLNTEAPIGRSVARQETACRSAPPPRSRLC